MMRRADRSGFTLIELLVVITIIVVLLALLTPALDRAISQAELAVCLSQQRGIGQGHWLRTNDHQGKMVRLEIWLNQPLPPYASPDGQRIINSWRYGSYTWMDELKDTNYIKNGDVYTCPTAESYKGPDPNLDYGPPLGIALNHIQLSLSGAGTPEYNRKKIKEPSRTVQFADAGRPSLGTFTNSDPDEWREDPGHQLHYFLTPDHGHHHTPPDDAGLNGRNRRMLNRHLNGETAATAHVDGHAEAMQTGEVGFQYWGAGVSDGDAIDTFDFRWLWDRR